MTPTAHARAATARTCAPRRRAVALWSGPVRTGETGAPARPAMTPFTHRDPLVDLVADAAAAARLGLLF